MKKLVKLVLVALVMVSMVGLFSVMNNKDLSLDFENSGSISWFDEDDYILSADASEVENMSMDRLKMKQFKISGFKNSGLPETIEIESMDL